MNKFTCYRKSVFPKTDSYYSETFLIEVMMFQRHQTNPYKIDVKSKHEKWGEKRNQNSYQNGPKSINKLCTNQLENRCETCDPKIHQKSGLGAPTGRQSDFGYSMTWRFRAGQPGEVPRINWKKVGPFDRKTTQKGSQHADGPKAQQIYIYIYIYIYIFIYIFIYIYSYIYIFVFIFNIYIYIYVYI